MKSITRFDAHVRALNIPIHGISGTGPACRIDFKPEATAPQIAQANSERATFDWAEKPDGDGAGFVNRVIDAVIASQISTQVAVQLMLLKSVADDEPRRKALWARMKADTSPPAGFVTRIETAAANANMPLV